MERHRFAARLSGALVLVLAAAALPAAGNLFFGAWPFAVGLAYVGTRSHWRKKWKDIASQPA